MDRITEILNEAIVYNEANFKGTKLHNTHAMISLLSVSLLTRVVNGGQVIAVEPVLTSSQTGVRELPE